MERNDRMVCIKTAPYGTPREGDKGTLVFGADYVPGLDAGRWTVKFEQPEGQPERALFGHAAANYWTESEMRETWAPDYALLSSEKPSSAQMDVWFDLIASYASVKEPYSLDHSIEPDDGSMLVEVTHDGLTRLAMFDRDGSLMGDWV